MLQMYVSLFTVEPRVIAQQISIVQEGQRMRTNNNKKDEHFVLITLIGGF